MDTKEFVKEKTEELQNTIVDKSVYQKAEDWIGEHNIMSRIIILAFVGVFIYSFVAPLPIAYAELIGWLLFSVFAIVSVGINSIKAIGNMIIKIRGK